jgi:transcriptional regulator with XRE-family HTH domain
MTNYQKRTRRLSLRERERITRMEKHRGHKLAPKLGENVRTLRLAAGLSQVELAVKAGIPQEFISRLERGAALPSLGKLAMIADGLGVSEADVLSRDDQFQTEIVASVRKHPNFTTEQCAALLALVHSWEAAA